jgi:hypothetical protein
MFEVLIPPSLTNLSFNDILKLFKINVFFRYCDNLVRDHLKLECHVQNNLAETNELGKRKQKCCSLISPQCHL